MWRYIATAVDRVRPGLGRRALRRLNAPAEPIEGPVDELLNRVAAFEGELVLVLDDVQAVTDPECMASLDYALDHLPANAHVIMLTRIDPALGLSQLRARGALAELRADDLAFTVEEAHELVVGRGGVDLDASEVEMLHQRTQGWPAALFLATYWLHRVDDPHTAAREFGGSHRFVADYLTREVIGSLDDDTRGLLLRACVLGRFTAELCDAVLDRSDSRELLEELEHSNLFVVRLEHGDWYRVHPLFAEFGRFQLDSSDPGAEPEIHSRAAAWLRTRDLPVEATEHASAAGDHQLLADLLVEHHLEMIRHGHARTLLRWVQTLSDEQIVEHPLLAVAAATAAAMIGGRTIERRRVMALAQRAARTRPSLFTPYVRAVLSMVRAATIDGNVGLAVVEGRVAVAIARTLFRR
jgi:LuxR family maltose regulon positive regulatory protein